MKFYTNYKNDKLKFDELKINTIINLKAYLTGLFFTALIFSLYYAVLINLMIFNFWHDYLIFGMVILTIIAYYFMLYFKDKALINYDERIKNLTLYRIRIIDTLFFGVVLMIIFIIVKQFNWW